MATTKFIDGSQGPILIECDDGGGSTTAAGPLISKSLQRISLELGKSLAEAEEGGPSELTVAFGLKLSSDGRVVITASGSDGTLSVQMKFGGGGGKPAFPGLPAGF